GAFALAGSAAPASDATRRPERSVTVAHGSVVEMPRDIGAIIEMLRSREQGTYIAEMLAGRDSALARWADRDGRPVTVWVRDTSDIED
ncbi:hypothetical protein NL449_27895, partial [Klebsiella pneumoniae]|nr:hypothetical protein [Klebsiella pneumoniae]